MLIVTCLYLITYLVTSYAQNYQVADISCDFGADDSSIERLTARLKKPPEFKGTPLFADDRKVNPAIDPVCRITHDRSDPSNLVYNLEITDFSRCGASKKQEYVHLRVWFPQIDGVVLATDQEVVIMCKPASPTIIENRAAGFAGSLPSAGRVSGVVEESPGTLEYEVALFRQMTGRTNVHHEIVDQAVPIGERLQLRARINTKSAWKFAKLLEVTVSNSPEDPYYPGYVALIQDGCRISDFTNIVPEQPRRADEDPGEVRLDFEAFMLDAKSVGSAQLWIHATIKACIQGRDCLPEFCLDLFHPSGHGRRRRDLGELLEETDALFENYDEAEELRISKSLSDEHLLRKNYSTLFVSRMAGMKNRQALVTQISVLEPKSVTKIKEFRNTDQNPKAEALTTQEEVKETNKTEGESAKVGDNVGLTVIMPEEFFSKTESMFQSCETFMVLSGVLGLAVLMCVSFLCYLTLRVQKSVTTANTSTLDGVIKEHHHKYGVRDFLDPPFQ